MDEIKAWRVGEDIGGEEPSLLAGEGAEDVSLTIFFVPESIPESPLRLAGTCD